MKAVMTLLVGIFALMGASTLGLMLTTSASPISWLSSPTLFFSPA